MFVKTAACFVPWTYVFNDDKADESKLRGLSTPYQSPIRFFAGFCAPYCQIVDTTSHQRKDFYCLLTVTTHTKHAHLLRLLQPPHCHLPCPRLRVSPSHWPSSAVARLLSLRWKRGSTGIDAVSPVADGVRLDIGLDAQCARAMGG